MSAFAGIDAVGKTFQIHQAVIAHFRDGLIVEAWEIADTGDLLRQVGATDVVADSDEDEGGESACPIHDPWNVMAELDVHPFGGGDVTEEKGADD